MIIRITLLMVALCTLSNLPRWSQADESEAAGDVFLSRVRQLTFEGKRAGEGYFSADGSSMVFQSEREPGNPFFQMYLLDLETGDTSRVSTGLGKTTCGWIRPGNDAVMFASTHADPDSAAKQQAELDFRESGKERRYSWDYDPAYDLWAFEPASSQYTQLTTDRGYDAEGSYSPDGNTILFASNRSAYDSESPLSEAKQEILERDPSYFIDLYRSDADGGNVVRLTDTPGYDGGPFFSPDGQRICWRRFDEDGATAEIMAAQLDGSDVHALTNLGAMSWAPYFHPSGDYLIFTTNLHGFANFELYLVRADGQGDPVRVTNTEGFDGLPVFHPNGDQLSWTSNRTSNKTSQIFLADWDHAAALDALGINAETATAEPTSARVGRPEYSPAEIAQHVEFLASERLQGRGSGTEGNRLATEYVASHFEALGLKPAGRLAADGEAFFDPFEFTAGVSLGAGNSLIVTRPMPSRGMAIPLKEDQFTPLAFSATGTFENAGVVFAGYGIQAPVDEANDLGEYDSYVHLDVKDKWVLVMRFLPDDVSTKRRQQLSRYSSLRRKATIARDLGAKGLIVFSGPESKVKNELVSLRFDGSLAGSSLPVISVTDAAASTITLKSIDELRALQTSIDTGEPVMGFAIDHVTVSAVVSIEQETSHDRNVLGRLQAGDQPSKELIVVGAHVDHLGVGAGGNSLARDDEREGIHYGADDNASGVAAMLEIAEAMTAAKSDGLKMKRDIVFAAWSGEELGLLGASKFLDDAAANGIGFGAVATIAHAHTSHGEHSHNHHASPAHSETANPHELHPHAPKSKPSGDDAVVAGALGDGSHNPNVPNPHATPPGAKQNPHAAGHLHGDHADVTAGPTIVACLNLDMVGRLRDALVLQGVGSSEWWPAQIERRNIPVGLPLTLSNDSYIPTDASAFYARGVPILSAFTGSHEDYHTPRDTPDKINYDGAASVAKLMGLITRSLAATSEPPQYVAQAKPKDQERRANLRAYLGTVPDYAQADVVGVKLSGVAKGGPAEEGGIQGGDVIVEVAGKKIENIYDYTFAIEALKIGEEVSIKVERKGQIVNLQVTPGSRD